MNAIILMNIEARLHNLFKVDFVHCQYQCRIALPAFVGYYERDFPYYAPAFRDDICMCYIYRSLCKNRGRQSEVCVHNQGLLCYLRVIPYAGKHHIACFLQSLGKYRGIIVFVREEHVEANSSSARLLQIINSAGMKRAVPPGPATVFPKAFIIYRNDDDIRGWLSIEKELVGEPPVYSSKGLNEVNKKDKNSTDTQRNQNMIALPALLPGFPDNER